MKSIVRCGAAALASLALAPLAMADNCALMAGKSQCFTFKYSTGGHNKYTGAFGVDGTFTLNGTNTGTYTCAGGLGLAEVDYTFAGKRQQWYAAAGAHGDTLKGDGKALDDDYMYKLSSKAGACGGDADAGALHQEP
jgi:hypothetical protein